MPIDIIVTLGQNTFDAKGVAEPINPEFVDVFKAWINAQATPASDDAARLSASTEKLKELTAGLQADVTEHTPTP